MMILKKFLTACIIVLLIFTGAQAMTSLEFLLEQETNLIELCEDGYGQASTSLLYECMLTEFYGLHKVIDLLITVEIQSEDWIVLVDLLEEYRWEDYNTFDFMAIHLEFEIYLENKDL